MTLLKKVLTITAISLGFLGTAQEENPQFASSLIQGSVEGGKGRVIALLQRAGRSIQQLAIDTLDDSGRYSLPANMSRVPGFYAVQMGGQQVTLMMMGGDTVTLNSKVSAFFNQAEVVGSPHNTDLLDYHSEIMRFRKVEDSLRMALRRNTSTQEEVNDYFKPIATNYNLRRQEFINRWQNSPLILATLYLNGVNREQEAELFEQLLELSAKNFAGSDVAVQLQREAENMKQQRLMKERTAPGKPAPEIALPSPDGDTIRLSDLKGKVVLIDFWASWCRPCRAENPNVVRTYQEYKDKGFTVFSVSLDTKAPNWKQAIQADGLVWPNHVSDLKGWSTSPIRDYGFRGIPYTVLVDEEGNIIKTNLRGPALEQELSRIFDDAE